MAECEEKIRNMEGALSLKILDQNNSRGNSRASSRGANRHGKRVKGVSPISKFLFIQKNLDPLIVCVRAFDVFG